MNPHSIGDGRQFAIGAAVVNPGPVPETLSDLITAAGLAALATAEILARQAMTVNTLRAYLL